MLIGLSDRFQLGIDDLDLGVFRSVFACEIHLILGEKQGHLAQMLQRLHPVDRRHALFVIEVAGRLNQVPRRFQFEAPNANLRQLSVEGSQDLLAHALLFAEVHVEQPAVLLEFVEGELRVF